MPRYGTWRDVTRTSRSGLKIEEYRISLAGGEAVLHRLPGAPFDPTLATSDMWSLRCPILRISETVFRADSAEKAKKHALALLKDNAGDLKATAEAIMIAIDKIQTAAKSGGHA